MNIKSFVFGAVAGGLCGVWLAHSPIPPVVFMEDPLSSQSNQDVVLALAFSNPQNDLQSALKEGDSRFVGIGSPGIYAPGAENEKNIKVISHYSDYVTSFAQSQINSLVINYAREYNKLLLEKKESKTEGSK